MVRRCVVGNCKESDVSILSHRFPKTNEFAEKWKIALNLQNFKLDELQKKFVVCTRHFAPKAYRNDISNSLNTTALPNLEKNNDNERIFTTEPSVKKQQQQISTATRCHKLPATKKNQEGPIISNVQRVKVIRLDVDGVTEYLKTHKAEIIAEEIQMIEEVVPVEDTEETFEVCEMPTDPEDNTDDEEEKNNLDAVTEPDESFRENEPEAAYLNEIVLSHKETQTDQLPPPEIITQQPLITKDDKLVKLLYPEFQEFDKIKLIELVIEKDRKIESLENKNKKLELAMKNLL